ncbi:MULTISPECIES: transcription factor FapR [Oceanobacillus]|nr:MULTISPECIES: transcription factor FapR [Oceanobacillus]MBT2598746.1 transcription factor FapR [Oceanobacillus sp. ISL-74]MBT2651665.1 transcription factor FapR [Oceanobacillus sp. ISL-73]MCT1576314.1 transcription factor FapR [Oceanobacillus kimchii]MCT2135950.1 transcription factor FapR [Oceanobacillus kimchii]OEH54768.1 fatty acid biosynthesis transcriptional regulator [Oceanobacillus sp. E9]
MKRSKVERQNMLKEKIELTPFVTDEQLAKEFQVSIQTIRLDRMELAIPELRERIKHVATNQWNETVKALPLEEVIGEVIDLELDERAISIMDITPDLVFSRNKIARGHHLFAQANSLAVAVINDELALTAKSNLKFTRQVNEGERVIAKAIVKGKDTRDRTIVEVNSYVENELVFTGEFFMFHSSNEKGEI